MGQFNLRSGRLLIVLCLSLLIGCGKSDSVYVLKLAHVLDAAHPVHKAMVFMGEKLAEKSGGTMRLDIYPSGQLGAERDLIELLQIGSLAMTKVATAPLEGFVPDMRVFGVPYIFRDDEHRWKVLNGEIGQRLLLAGTQFNIRGMCYYDSGSRSFYTKNKPIRSPADLKGQKIRVMKSRTAMKMVESLGGSPTPIPWGELYTSLQQGVVDGAENNPPTFYFSRHYEVCKYYSLDEHTTGPDILIMSTVVWKNLTTQQQQWVQEAIDESAIYQRSLWKTASDDAIAAVKAAGVEVIYPDKSPFQDAVVDLHASYEGTRVYELLQEIAGIE